MRKLALATLALFALAGGALAAVRDPHLRITRTSPLTVMGSGFKSHEQVNVLYRSEQTWTRHAIATSAGTFTARFAGVRFVPCKNARLTATGSKGSKSFFKMPPTPCPPPTDGP
jgi:hypothetical protein